MALLIINGVTIPTPTDVQVTVADISNAQRNAQGLMIIERIATKHTITITYAYITSTDLSTVLSAVAPVYYNVTYLDPVVNKIQTGSFYCGDRSLGLIDYIGGVPRYQNVKFELIER